MNSQSHTDASQAMAAYVHAMTQHIPADPVEVINAATRQQSHLLWAEHFLATGSMHAVHAGVVRPLEHEAMTSPATEAPEHSHVWPLVAAAVAVLLALGVSDSLLARHHAQPAVEAAPFAQVFDLTS